MKNTFFKRLCVAILLCGSVFFTACGDEDCLGDLSECSQDSDCCSESCRTVPKTYGWAQECRW